MSCHHEPHECHWTHDELAALDRGIGEPALIPGELLLDVDGLPLGMTPNTAAVLGVVAITRAEVERCGLDPDNYPNITFTD